MKTSHKEKDLFIKICRFCSYRERAISEVCEKMNALEISLAKQEAFIQKLVEEKFINETRYAESFARGKFRNNKWGKQKIILHLKQKGISNKDINGAIQTIEERLYKKTIRELILLKQKSYKEKNIIKQKQKIAQFLYAKGYEIDFIWKELNEIIPS